MEEIWSSRSLDCSEKILPERKEKELTPSEWDAIGKFIEYRSLETIQYFSLRFKNLKQLPSDFGVTFQELKSLNLSNNQLQSVPPSLHLLTKLKYLYLNENRFSQFPLVITELSSLTELKLSHNELSELPESIAKLQSLTKLLLNNNKLKELPVSCGTMNQLKILDLTGNLLTNIPKCVVTGMINLESLHLSSNENIYLFPKPKSQQLRRFYVQKVKNNIRFPLWIFGENAQNLDVVNFDGTVFEPFDFCSKRFSLSVRLFSAKGCRISEKNWTKILRVANNLETLEITNIGYFLSHDASRLLFTSIKCPEKMRTIHFRTLGLSDICPEIARCVNLVTLDIGDNNLNWLPDEICSLANLENLNVAQNFLTQLPANMCNMKALKHLIAHNNCLETLPKSFSKLKNLVDLDLYENSFKEIPSEMKCMEKLIALDLDQNPGSAESLQIRNIHYRTLRENLRMRSKQTGRNNGPKPAQKWPTLDDENWDISEDSADEFDPECSNDKPKKRHTPSTFSYLKVLSRSCDYCPARFHPLPIKQQIYQLQLEGLLQQNSDTIVEGQFDDI